jgi:hypothetical protein
MAQTLLKQRGMSAVFWGEAVVMAVYILNRSPTKDLNGRTSNEAWHGRKLAVSHLWVFGCLAFGKELGHIGKLDDRSTPEVFDEVRGWAWDKAVDDSSTMMYDNFTIKYVHFEEAGTVGSSLPPNISTPVPEPPLTSAPHSPVTTSAATRSLPPPPQLVTPCTPASMATPPGMSTPTLARVEHNLVEFATPLSHDEERINMYHDGKPLRYHTMENLLDDQPVLGLVPYNLEAQLHLTCDDGEPRSFAEAERHVAWHAAMQSEMKAVEKNCTWELVDLPRGHSVITLK